MKHERQVESIILDSPALNVYVVNFRHLDNHDEASRAFQRAASIVMQELRSASYEREPPERRRAFTARLVDAATEASRANDAGVSRQQNVADVSRQQGNIVWFSVVKGYGFVSCGDGQNAFLHYTELETTGYRFPKAGEAISFALAETERGRQAHAARFLD